MLFLSILSTPPDSIFDASRERERDSKKLSQKTEES